MASKPTLAITAIFFQQHQHIQSMLVPVRCKAFGEILEDGFEASVVRRKTVHGLVYLDPTFHNPSLRWYHTATTLLMW